MARAGAGRPSRKGGHKATRRPKRQWSEHSSPPVPRRGEGPPERQRGGLSSPPSRQRGERQPDGERRRAASPNRRRTPSDRKSGLESLPEPRQGKGRGAGSPDGRRTPPDRKGGLESPPRGRRRESPPHGRKSPSGRQGDGLSSLPSRRGVELLYGRNAVLEALRAGRRHAYTLAVASGAKAEGTLGAILALAQERNLPLREVERQELDRLAANHQGVALETSPYPYEDLDALIGRADERALFLLLDLIEDPQNLGTLLRTADAVGVAGVAIPARRAAGVTPAVSNASAGAVEYLPVAQVTNLVQAMEALRAAGVWLAGLEDLPEAQLYDEANWSGPTALIVGSEGRGMRRLVRERCDFIVRLPMAGHVSSLNAAVAGSIVLYHAWRRRTAGA